MRLTKVQVMNFTDLGPDSVQKPILSNHYMYYNFGRIHQSLRVTPAMEAGIADHV